jgi:REP element-mobilizing transposase RayT
MPYYRLYYHFIWTTKGRLPIINAANRKEIYQAIVDKVEEHSGIVHAVNGIADHVHLVATVPPNVALSTLIGQVKGFSSHVVAQLSKESDPFAWQNEYAVLSVSESDLPAVIRYVRLQQQHHAEGKLDKPPAESKRSQMRSAVWRVFDSARGLIPAPVSCHVSQ